MWDYYFKDPLFLDELNILLKKLLLERFKISNISKSTHYKLLHFLIYNYFVFGEDDITITKLKKYFKICWNKLNAILDDLERAGLIVVNGGVVALSNNIIDTIFNLIDLMQNCEKRILELYEELDEKDLRLRDIKELARSFIRDKNYLSLFEKMAIYELFNYYVEKANDLKIVLKKKNKNLEDLEKDDILILDYITRFNSKKRIYQMVKKFKEIIKKASKSYKYALFITLTVDINNKKILDSFREISKAFKKFKDLLRKKYGIKSYVKVLEFTKAGVPHLHILFFTNKIKNGKEWIISQKWISEKWESYGMGKIVYIYALKSLNNSFVWLNAHPKNCKSKNISDYLSKYLYKAFKEKKELAFYWLSNLRFYTNSRDLNILNIKKEQKENKKEWEFLGVLDVDKIDFERLKKDIVEYIKELFRDKYKNNDYKINIWDIGYSIKEKYYYKLIMV